MRKWTEFNPRNNALRICLHCLSHYNTYYTKKPTEKATQKYK